MTKAPVSAPPAGRVKSLHTALAVLSEFLGSQLELGVAELVEKTGMPKGQISKILATYRDNGFLHQDPKTRRYSVGLRTFLLGSRFASFDRLIRHALPVMRALSEKTGHSVRLSVMDQDKVAYLIGLEGRALIDSGWRAGAYLPLHSTSAGRVVLAFMDPARAEQLIAGLAMESYTPSTVTDRKKLRAIIAGIRHSGHSAQRGETNAGLATVAVPLFGDNQAILGVLGFAYPVQDVPEKDEPALAAMLHKAAQSISQRMGCVVYPFGRERAPAPARRAGAGQ
jgi:DNA-binding IclR family transcriptional regulator